MSARGYDPSSTAPSDVRCSECDKAIPENIVAEWLWRYNGMPDPTTCSMECAHALYERTQGR